MATQRAEQLQSNYHNGTLTAAHIQAESDRRNSILFGTYDPVTGQGSLIPRTPFQLAGITLYIPASMAANPLCRLIAKKGIAGAAAELQLNEAETLELFVQVRCKFDYEFWAYTCAHIKNKKGQVVPFRFNLSQRKSIAEREQLRAEGRPVWQLELKDRQYGSSTEKNAYLFWLQNVVYEGHNSYIISLDKDVVIDIVDRYQRIAENYPAFMPRIRMKGYRGARNTIQIEGKESFIYLGSVERPNAPSGRTVQHVLISEAGKMKSTLVKSAETLITNIVSLVPEERYTTLLIESTAEQSGRWFREECMKALRGESGYHLTFINWITNEDKWKGKLQLNSRPVSAAEFIESFTLEEWGLWAAGASLEQINWYKIRAKRYPNEWQMKQENPTYPHEAFQTAGTRYFKIDYVRNMEAAVRAPKAIGNIISDGNQGEKAFENIRFEPAKNGRVWIWEFPEDIAVPGSVVNHQTAAFMDIGGRSEKSDKHAATIINRFWMLEMGIPEVVAEYRGNLDLDLAAWEVAKLAYWYHKALLAIEVNTIINKQAREGNYEGEGSLAIMNEINQVYPNLYARTVPDNRDANRGLKKLGFHMNPATKVMLYTSLNAALRDYGYVERSTRAIHEMNSCILNEGRIEAMQGEHDDLLDTRAGAYWLATDYMRPPEVITPQTRKTKRQPKTEAHI